MADVTVKTRGVLPSLESARGCKIILAEADMGVARDSPWRGGATHNS